MFSKVKTVLEASVLTMAPASALGLLREPGRLLVTTGCARYGYDFPATRFCGESGAARGRAVHLQHHGVLP
jgi:hypothetical protein